MTALLEKILHNTTQINHLSIVLAINLAAQSIFNIWLIWELMGLHNKIQKMPKKDL